jgi:hypothetical protein
MTKQDIMVTASFVVVFIQFLLLMVIDGGCPKDIAFRRETQFPMKSAVLHFPVNATAIYLPASKSGRRKNRRFTETSAPPTSAAGHCSRLRGISLPGFLA